MTGSSADDIAFLEGLRETIDEYLFLGYAPPVRATNAWGDIEPDSQAFSAALEKPAYQALRRKINEMKPRAKEILRRCGFSPTIVQPPGLGRGGGEFYFLDVVTENRTFHPVQKQTIFDPIEQAIGALKLGLSTGTPDARAMLQFTKGYVFIAMPMIESDAMLDDVHEAIKAAAGDLGLHAERVDDPSSSERITDRVISSIRNAEYVVVDLTHGRPNVYFEAGYAHGFGKVPIYIARRDTPIEFDVKDYPVIFFRNIKELRQRLKERLQAAPRTQNAAGVATVGDSQPVVRDPNLSDTGRELLSAAAQDRHGLIAMVEDRHKTYIHTNGREFAGSDEARLVALWRGAVTELLGLNFIEDRTGRGREFHVTDAGYLAAGSPSPLTPRT